ncbi:hypothetical protein Patl1_12372 [Pistacia atlantica]|uniref:Uncharacterized protein n=1 Tax=Pistacia atlantica TaxID=434234 RepID=A0ACC1A5K9_9ROSI|nr:hypothetical protein Patl1_12372 [Pistacia atlantica]
MLLDDSKISEIIRKPWPLIREATKQGNLEFLNIIFGAYPDLIFEVDEQNHSIFHWAALYRQRKIFKIIRENGPFRDWVVQNTNEHRNILHVAANLPPSDRPNIGSGGAPLQLQEELLLFKEVKEILHPLDAESTNEEVKTARAIFTEQHKELKDKAERWIKDTVSSCLVAATIVASVVFAALFTVPGGYKEETGTPHFVRRASFIIFAISDAIALISSSFSMIRFLSVIAFPYSEEDFISLLPRFLGSGLGALSFSISAMMVVFCATMFIVFKDGMLWIPILVMVMAYFTILIFQGIFQKIMVNAVVKSVFFKDGMR